MVAVGDGSHRFTKTLREHNKAKAAFDKVRREVNRKKRREGRN
jgi:cell division protein YceG involved in septum cleavage